jgi:hypothetical protein
MSPNSTRQFPMLGYWIALAAIVILANIPLFVSAYGGWVAEQHGCAVSVGYISECMIDGLNKGAELQRLVSSGLYALLTWPLGLVAFVVWLVFLFRHRARWKRAARGVQ